MDTSHNHKLQHYFFAMLLLAVGVIMFLIFKPFIAPLVLGISFAVVFQPLYNNILTRYPEKRGLAALLTILIVILLVVIPLIFIGSLLFTEARDLYVSLTSSSGSVGAFTTVFQNIEGYLQGFLPEISINVAEYLQNGLQWILGNLGSFFSGFLTVSLDLFIMLVALFYLLRDGEKFKRHYIALSPLSNTYDERIFEKLNQAINSVIKGSLVIAAVQGLLAGLGMWIFGIPNPIIWGVTAMIASLIPGIGTALVIGPAVLYLFFVDHVGMAIGLIIWGVAIVGLVDNMLAPNLINRGIKIHPLLILISVLGGILFFGPIGFLLGPLVLALFFALLDIYPLILK
ncbi:AI-2E family transporter [Candidatus Parcubacteria bacterium]|nr:AI-2E family transporter [Candidatus Parcubacteria bacterium]